jgi:four helix bundle protein
MGNYQELSVWKSAHGLALAIYQATHAFPDPERYGLTSQLRRGAVSIASNIAAMSSRKSNREQAKFLRIALGSLCEIECQLILSRDLGYLRPDVFSPLLDSCRKSVECSTD